MCPEWKEQQKILWAEVWAEVGRGKSRFKIGDLLADEKSSQAVLDFLSTTDVGILASAEEDAGSNAFEWERRERREREEERRAEAEEPGVWEEPALSLPTPAFMASAGEEYGRARFVFGLSFPSFLLSFSALAPFVLSFAISLVRICSFLGQAGRREKELATCRHASILNKKKSNGFYSSLFLLNSRA